MCMQTDTMILLVVHTNLVVLDQIWKVLILRYVMGGFQQCAWPCLIKR